MKRLLLLSFLTVSAFAQSLASARVIEKPAFLYQNSSRLLRIDSVTMTDTATVIDLFVLWHRNLLFFSRETCLRDMKGRTYPLRQIISDYNLQLDEPKIFKEEVIRQSAIKLVFPSLPADVAEVDMIDPLYYNYGLFGIRLDGSPLPPLKLPKGVEEQLTKLMVVQDTLPAVDYRFGWATVKGHLLEYRPGMGSQITMIIGHTGTWPGRHCDTLCAEVTPSGDFTFRLPVAHVTPVMLELLLEDSRGIAYVGPGTETEIYVNIRELAYRRLHKKANLASNLFVTKGPLAQLANELNQHLFWYRLDFDEQNFKTLFHDKKEYERFIEIRDMLPTKQLELRIAALDTMKVERQWSPAMKELVRLYGQLKTAQIIRYYPSNELEKEAKVSPEAQKQLIDWQRDAVIAEVNTYKQLINNPKQLYCPDFIFLIENNNNVSTLLPDFVANEKKLWKLRQQMDDFLLLNPDEISDQLANLPPAYRQLVLAWQDIYREERDRMAETSFDCDTLFLQGIPDTLIVQTLRERYRGHTLFIHFWKNFSPDLINNAVLPLQHELTDLDIIWITIYTYLPKPNDGAYVSYARLLRYGVWPQGEHYFCNVSSRIDRLLALYKTMGLSKVIPDPFCIISPDGQIVSNNEIIDKTGWPGIDYLFIRHCLRQTAQHKSVSQFYHDILTKAQ